MGKNRIAIQGIETSFHEVAAKKYFGDNISPVECWTFTELCESLENGTADYAVMAIENSIAGSLLQNYGLLEEYHFFIIGEVFLRIEMNLMALPNQRIEDIKVVQSHPIAIRQCSKFLHNLGPHVKLQETEDTAASAREISENKVLNYAAVANRAAAKRFGLEILAENIETNKNNFTRFVVLSKNAHNDSKNNKATISFNLSHETGSLAKVLNMFSEHQINLTKIQSVPIIGKPYKYNFHVDIEWKSYEHYINAKKAVIPFTVDFKVLGEYQHGDFESLRAANKV